MPLTVWKYEIPLEDEFSLDLPSKATILTIQVQPSANAVMLWALVNPESQKTRRYFRLAGTGHPISYPKTQLTYVQTFQLYGGELVFHLFEIV